LGTVSSLVDLVVDDDGLFISGPAIVIIIEDNRPIRRRFDFSLIRSRMLLPQAQMAEDAFYASGS
jgi:hypothetical protein